MGVDSGLYEAVLVLHIVAVVIGFGGMFISAFYGNEASRRPGREGLAVGETTAKVTALAPTMAIYTVPILGIILIMLSDDTFKFSEAWVSLSFVLYIVLVVLLVTQVAPASKKIVAMRAAAQGEMTADIVAEGKKLATMGGIVNVLWVVVLILMVFKPGH